MGRALEELLSEEDEVLTPKARRVQFVREALGLAPGVVEREVAREARRVLRDKRPRMNTANVQCLRDVVADGTILPREGGSRWGPAHPIPN
jgi:hypothetical protein